MDRLEDFMKARVQAVAKGTKIGRVTEDENVRTWLVFGRMAMFFTIWAAMICAVAMVVAYRP